MQSYSLMRPSIITGISLLLATQQISANAQTIVNIQKTNTNFSIDGNRGVIQGQQLYVWASDERNVNQQWIETKRDNNSYSYQKKDTQLCIDGGNGGAKRQAVRLQPCDANNQNQHWNKIQTANNSIRLEKRNAPGFSIDSNNGAKSGQVMYLWNSDSNNINQRWSFTNVGEPTNSNCPGTNDLPKCMQDMANNGGGTIVLDAKTYRLRESLLLQDNVNIKGQGASTIIRFDNDVANTIDEPLLLGLKVNDIELSDFTLRCSINQNPNSNDLRNDHMGIFMDGPGDPSLGEATDNNNVRMERIEAYYCSNGMHLKGLTGFVGIDLDLHHNGNTEVDLFHNIYLRRVADVHLSQSKNDVGGFYSSNRGHGIRLSHIRNAYFGNLAVYNNADHGVHMTDGVYDMRFYNLRNNNNCANSSGACGEFRCYGSDCDIDQDAAQEAAP